MCRFRVGERPIGHIFHHFQNVLALCRTKSERNHFVFVVFFRCNVARVNLVKQKIQVSEEKRRLFFCEVDFTLLSAPSQDEKRG